MMRSLAAFVEQLLKHAQRVMMEDGFESYHCAPPCWLPMWPNLHHVRILAVEISPQILAESLRLGVSDGICSIYAAGILLTPSSKSPLLHFLALNRVKSATARTSRKNTLVSHPSVACWVLHCSFRQRRCAGLVLGCAQRHCQLAGVHFLHKQPCASSQDFGFRSYGCSSSFVY